MSHSRCFCDELLLIAEESFAAFSGVSPDLFGDSRATSKASHQDDSGEWLYGTGFVDLRKPLPFDVRSESLKREVKTDDKQVAVEARLR